MRRVEQFSIECCIASIGTHPSNHFGFRCTYKTIPFIHFSHYQVCHSKFSFFNSVLFNQSISVYDILIFKILPIYLSSSKHSHLRHHHYIHPFYTDGWENGLITLFLRQNEVCVTGWIATFMKTA